MPPVVHGPTLDTAARLTLIRAIEFSVVGAVGADNPQSYYWYIDPCMDTFLLASTVLSGGLLTPRMLMALTLENIIKQISGTGDELRAATDRVVACLNIA